MVDASITLAWLLDEGSAYADAVLESLFTEVGVTSPIWRLELANSLLVSERRGRITADESAEAMQRIQPLRIEVDQAALENTESILALAREQRLTSYDASYLELAMRRGLPLATLDGELRDAAPRVGVAVVGQ